MAITSSELGELDIKKLLLKQSIPASIGILFMSLNILVDTIFVGQWIGSLAIAAVSVVLPFTFLISSLGMAIGVGGSSIISRALGAKEPEKAEITFGNQITMTLILALGSVSIGYFFSDEVLVLFGANGAILQPAKEFYFPVLLGVPFLALCMTGNTVIRAEGKPKFAMYAMLIPAFGNLILDIVFIKVLDYGIFGAALATSISYFLCFLFILWFFIAKSEIRISTVHLVLKGKIVREISSLGFVTFARQGVVSLLAIIVNTTLFVHSGEAGVTIYGIINRMLMFALFPILGITQGFLPVAGYNFGAQQYHRVRQSIYYSIISASVLATIIFLGIFIFSESLIRVFTNDETIIHDSSDALRWVFAVTPIIAIQLIGAAYFQAIGKAIPALLLTLTKQGFFLIPLVIILPKYFGTFGVWLSFPISDVLATLVTGYFLRKEIKATLKE
jgi:putative MATE family efflux protein